MRFYSINDTINHLKSKRFEHRILNHKIKFLSDKFVLKNFLNQHLNCFEISYILVD